VTLQRWPTTNISHCEAGVACVVVPVQQHIIGPFNQGIKNDAPAPK
jgi:hypothetical protein